MLKPDELISKFHETLKSQYPDLTLEELNVICRSPFIFLRDQMKLLTLPSIRFKYWGIFKVKKGFLKVLPGKIDKNRENIKPKNLIRMDTIIDIHNLKSQNDEK